MKSYITGKWRFANGFWKYCGGRKTYACGGQARTRALDLDLLDLAVVRGVGLLLLVEGGRLAGQRLAGALGLRRR